MAKESHAQRVAAEVRVAMARSRVTQAALALELGVSQAAVSRRLTGMVDFSVSELDAVARVVGVPTASLLPADLVRSAS